LHQLFSFENDLKRLYAPERMTDERRPIRQIPGDPQEFHAATSELKPVTPEIVIYESAI
jgi:hypothetical protein